MNVQKLARVLHRDVGYFLTVLVSLYCVSGVAVNHMGDWNPNFRIEEYTVKTAPLPRGDLDAMEAAAVKQLGFAPQDVQGRHLLSPTEFKLFLRHGGEAVLDPVDGGAFVKLFHQRPLLFESNALHLNHLKGVWTIVADIFALLLLGLAVTGLLILKGPQGFWGRGKWFFAAGTLLPLAFIVQRWLTH
ncbi:MAG: hypothetical protein ABIJ96_09490 [Elusimicrobiota bacterium]